MFYIISDINECMSPLSVCEHSCENAAGSFKCVCERGYKLNEDERSCDGKILS